MNLIETILSEVNLIDRQTSVNKEIYCCEKPSGSNEFLLILKPELFIKDDRHQLKNILELIISQLDFHNLQIENVRLHNAAYLQQYDVIASHYGVINAVARNFHSNSTNESKVNFQQIYNLNIEDAEICGALELLESGRMDRLALNELWKNCEIKRLGSGIYCGKVEYKGNDLFIINGFHPPQLEHFIAPNRLIVTMNIIGDTSWKIARREMTGNTYPEKADAKSIRGALYQQYGNFGFNNVSYVINSIHLSAGPLEGLIELMRFNSAYEKNELARLDDFSFGKMLLENFDRKKCEMILKNPTVQYMEKPISLFDLTEELNCDEAIEVLNSVL